MIVEEVMQTNIHTLQPENTVADALELCQQQNVRHIPVTDIEKKLVGLVTDRDLKKALPSPLNPSKLEKMLQKPVGLLMKTNVVTGHPLDFVEDAAAALYDQKISCLPVIQQGTVVGIITETDLLHTFVELTGSHTPGSRLEVRVPDKAGILFCVLKVMNKRRVQIQSVLVYPDQENKQRKILVLRIRTMNPLDVIADLKAANYDVLWPNMPGVRL